MNIHHGWCQRVIPLSATRKYSPEELRAMCKRVSPPLWLNVEGRMLQIQGEECLAFSCQISATYHNSIAYNAPEDDGFAEDMRERERRIRGWSDDTTSSGGEDVERQTGRAKMVAVRPRPRP
jgi:hypothetical protein